MSRAAALVALLALASFLACDNGGRAGADADAEADAGPEAEFIGDRDYEPCDEVHETCLASTSAGCSLEENTFTRGQLPGIRRFLVATTGAGDVIRLRMLFTTMLIPGTEILARAFEPDCGREVTDFREDVDVFEEAGDDAILDLELTMTSPGEHLVELSSSCAAEYVLTVEVLEL